jgi:hypothetical protein
MAYSDVQKAAACAMVKQNSGVIDDVIIATIRIALDEPKLPKMTIWRWWKHYLAVTLPDVTEKTNENVTDVIERQALDEKLENAAHKFIDHAMKDELLLWTSSKDAMTAAGIAIDKMRLLRNLPTEIVAVLPDLVETIKRKGYDPAEAIKTIKSQFEQLPDMLTSTHGVN